MDTLSTETYRGIGIDLYSDYDSSEFYYSDLKAGYYGLLVRDDGHQYESFGETQATGLIEKSLDCLDTMAIYRRMPPEAREAMKERAHQYEETIAEYWNGCGFRDYINALEYTDLNYLERIEAFCNALKIDCHSFSVHGYSQGDYAELLLIDDETFPDFKAAKKHVPESVEHILFTGFISYTVEETGDGCSGYESEEAAIEDAKECIDSHLEHLRLQKQGQTKAYIQNHVPISSRIQS